MAHLKDLFIPHCVAIFSVTLCV